MRCPCLHSIRSSLIKVIRTLVKRANTLTFTSNGSTILVGDKFGDVYDYPVQPSETSAAETEAEKAKLAPKLGHVSMLTGLVLGQDDASIITADRDEHVRVSAWPNGYDIIEFLLGHTK